MPQDTKSAEDLFGISAENRLVALENENKLSQKIKDIEAKTSVENMNLEFFIDGHSMFGGIVISKHADSDYVNIVFRPNIEGKTVSIHMTEKAYLKLHEAIDVFKLKSINTRQFEEN